MKSMFAKVDALRSEVKRRKEAIYARLARGEDTAVEGPLHERAGALRNLQTQLDDLWHGIYTGVLDARAASLQLSSLEQSYTEVMNSQNLDG